MAFVGLKDDEEIADLIAYLEGSHRQLASRPGGAIPATTEPRSCAQLAAPRPEPWSSARAECVNRG